MGADRERWSRTSKQKLNALHNAFNGYPAQLDTAIGLMYDLRTSAVALMETDSGDGSGQTVGPSFEYVELQGGMPTNRG